MANSPAIPSPTPSSTGKPLLVVLAGATASGKTALAVRLAQQLGCAVHSADSRQLYQQMDIGTAKPSLSEQGGVPHYGLDLISPNERYSAQAFAEYTLANLAHTFAQNPVQILCGGTGFYIQAVCEGMDSIPDTPPVVRQQVQAMLDNEGLEAAVHQLAELDPATHSRIDLKNPRRVQRALEVFLATGTPLSQWQQGNQAAARPFRTLYFGIQLERAALHQRIAQRVENMLRMGLVDEVRTLLQQYPPDAPGLQTIGYAEVVAHLQGKLAYAQMQEQIVQHTRQYAKRQMTWLRRTPEMRWIAPQDHTPLLAEIARHA